MVSYRFFEITPCCKVVAPGAKQELNGLPSYLEALDVGNLARLSDARYLSPTDPAAAWNVKEGRGKD
ncbi:MAG TPA: hypothetical protein VK638_48350 [Edaphobacter sp.]|nr:hypothetical protein [Edaphobacter sp.]